MHAHRFRGDPYRRSVDGDDPPGTQHRHDPFGDFFRVFQHRARLPPRHQPATWQVGPVGERLGDAAQPEVGRFVEERRTGEPEHRQRGSTACTASATARACTRSVTIVLYSAPWGLTYMTAEPAARASACSAPIW